MPRKTKQEQIAYADNRACYWLAEMNELDERGKGDTAAYREAQRKAHYWLDRWNELIGAGNPETKKGNEIK